MIALGSLAIAALVGDGSLASALEAVQQRCFECHAGSGVKGGLSLDTLDGWRSSVDLADPAGSELLYRLGLPADDPDAMPPQGERLSKAASLSLENWMAKGGDLAPIEDFLNGIAKQRLDLSLIHI